MKDKIVAVTSLNFDTILCIFSLDLCLSLYLVMNISMIYDHPYNLFTYVYSTPDLSPT